MSETEDISERLARARRKAGFMSPREAGQSFGWNENTYKSRENGVRGLTDQDEIRRYARGFKVSFIWLLSGEGDIEANTAAPGIIPVMGFIGAGAVIEPEYEQIATDGLFTIELPFPVPDEMLGFEVRGDSMMPRYDEGDVIVVWKDQKRPLDAFYGEEAAVRLDDGRRFLKVLARGSSRAVVTLNSFNAKPIEDVRLAWLGEIYVTVRSGQVRRLKVQERSAAIKRGRAREKLTDGMGDLPLRPR